MVKFARCNLLVFLLTIIGCSSTPDTESSVVSEPLGKPAVASKPVCTYERATGSNLRRKRCFTPKEREEMSRESKKWLRTGGRSGGAIVVRDPADPRDNDND